MTRRNFLKSLAVVSAVISPSYSFYFKEDIKVKIKDIKFMTSYNYDNYIKAIEISEAKIEEYKDKIKNKEEKIVFLKSMLYSKKRIA